MKHTFYSIRFSDCDPFGHLNNARYIDYMLNAREDHLRNFHQLDLDSYYKQGIGWVVSSHEIQYIRPANYNETICVESDLIGATDSNLLVEMRMLDKNRNSLKALLWSGFTCINIRTGRKDAHNPELMQTLQQLVTPGIDVSVGIKARAAGIIGKFVPVT